MLSPDNSLFRRLPQVQKLLEMPAAAVLVARFGAKSVTAAFRARLEDLRESIGAGLTSEVPDSQTLVAECAARLTEGRVRGLRRTINATGIVLHTNLGRSPMAAEALAAVVEVAAGYCNLEFDLASGGRGSRTQSVETLMCELTQADACLAVNNGAAAILLALSALANGGDVIVSRGELVEIGGGFRIPDVIRQGGARLIEVGTTNRTRLEDYRAAIGPDTRVLLKVHQSNFRMMGFTTDTSIEELAGLAHSHRLMVVADVGSGSLERMHGAEPTVTHALSSGADLVTFSGDKLLGGPQAGLIVGRKVAIDPLRAHPLLRAVRLDKMAIAALEATLLLHRDTPERIPLNRMLRQEREQLRQRALQLQTLAGIGTIENTASYVGGGALPEERIESVALAVASELGADRTAARLRTGGTPVIGRIHEGRLLLDMLAVADSEVAEIAAALRAALS